ncbi:MAG: hypothetical protein ACPKM0_00330 [Pleomorphochaeta sp.]
MSFYLYKVIVPFVISYTITYLLSLFLLNKVTILISKSKPELEGFHKNKETIPNIGGIAFIFATFITTAFFSKINTQLIYTIALILSFAILGFIDDNYKRFSDNGDGIKSLTKLFWQFAISILFVLVGTSRGYIASGISFFMKDGIVFSVLENCFLIFLMVYFVNAFNITDGLDGLAGYVSLPLFVVFILITLCNGNSELILVLNVSLFAAILAFLHFNRYPAKYFMGDCGSMALGSSLLIIALTLRLTSIFIIASLIFSLELFSSFIQIVAIRVFKKKVFSIAPIHHLYEQKGESEAEIVNLFARLSALFSIIALILYCYKYF